MFDGMAAELSRREQKAAGGSRGQQVTAGACLRILLITRFHVCYLKT
jgi:hypothetical protein